MAGKFEMYEDKSGHYRYRLKSGNGEVIAVGEAYNSRSACEKGIESVKQNAAGAPVKDLGHQEK
ncbi:YegP family protein [Streptomyces sp. NPDC008001]|uniref:YegP family protein n=1 Tax=Streptomyces sp. NPDC008001 TaxID=3364804 RepID=UPI0036E458E2